MVKGKKAIWLLTAAIGSKSQATSIIRSIETWKRSCGPEWTVTRLKALYNAACHLRAGHYDQAESIYRTNGIGFSKINGNIPIAKGSYRPITNSFITASGRRVLQRLCLVFRFYTDIKLDTASQKQMDKSRSSITGLTSVKNFAEIRQLPVNKETIHRFNEALVEPEIYELIQDGCVILDLVSKMPEGANHPDLGKLKPFTSSHLGVNLVKRHLRDESWHYPVASLLSSVYLPPTLESIVEQYYQPLHALRAGLIANGADTQTAGHISIIQESGCKGRVVAVPNVWIQLFLQPVHSCLDKITQGLERSCVHNQLKALRLLASERKLWCYDLSSATDCFPRLPQLHLLNVLGKSTWARAIDEISRGKWDFPDGSCISYTVGQPMGMYGSFPLFHLTHLCLLEGLRARHSKCDIYTAEEDQPDYLVLGDDVIITHESMAQDYHRIMTNLGVGISADKSFISDKVAEFAGFMSFSTKRGKACFRPYKWRTEVGLNPLHLVYSINENSERLGPFWAKLYGELCTTMPERHSDLSPIITEEKEIPRDPTLDSYTLGSLMTRLPWEYEGMPYPDLSPDATSRALFDLLGRREIATSGSYAMPLRNQNGLFTNLPKKHEILYKDPFYLSIAADPLIKALRESSRC